MHRFGKITFLLFLFLLFTAHGVSADSFFFPMTNFQNRITQKPFGLLIDSKFYKGKEELFPARPTGFHAGVDLEILDGETEKIIPVYAITDSTVLYTGTVEGYGGVILLSLTGLDSTALYGHIKLNNFSPKIGDTITKGSLITYLGDAFSEETGGERKHLHFALYKGTSEYFKGHETTEKDLNSKWIDPVDFLNTNKAQEPGSMENTDFRMTDTSVIAQPVPQNGKVTVSAQPQGDSSFLTKIARWIQNLFL